MCSFKGRNEPRICHRGQVSGSGRAAPHGLHSEPPHLPTPPRTPPSTPQQPPQQPSLPSGPFPYHLPTPRHLTEAPWSLLTLRCPSRSYKGREVGRGVSGWPKSTGRKRRTPVGPACPSPRRSRTQSSKPVCVCLSSRGWRLRHTGGRPGRGTRSATCPPERHLPSSPRLIGRLRSWDGVLPLWLDCGLRGLLPGGTHL